MIWRRAPMPVLVMASLQRLRHADDVDTLQLAEPGVEPRLVRGADNDKNAGSGAFAEGFADVGDHAQVADLPAAEPYLRIAFS